MGRRTLNIVDENRNNTRGDACSFPSGRIASVREEPAVHAAKDFGGNVALVTLGCAKNLVDSEVMLGVLKQKGFRLITEVEQADLIIVNTCAFLESAVKEGIDKILELAKYKETGRCRKLVVAGCMVERYRGDLAKSFPEVDRFISTDELLSVADDNETSDTTFSDSRRPYFIYDESMPRIRSTLGHTSYVKISEGCDRPCAFCIIPKIRGSFRSRPVRSVFNEIKGLVEDGVKEINLVAQDLTAYGSDLSSNKKPLLINLLKEINTLDANFWLRLLYAYPIGVNEELIRVILDSPVICNYLDLPLQHISNSVLKRMNRPLGEKGTRGLIEQIKKIAPNLALRTTFVLGFPGETEEDVLALESFVKEGHFTHVGAFTYSNEAEAKAYSYPNQVEEKVKQASRDKIMLAQQQLVEKRNANYVGKKLNVLLEGFHQDSKQLLTARATFQAPETDGEIIINNLSTELMERINSGLVIKDLLGMFAEVEITSNAGYDLVGTLVSV